jgi:hypothetical protein
MTLKVSASTHAVQTLDGLLTAHSRTEHSAEEVRQQLSAVVRDAAALRTHSQNLSQELAAARSDRADAEAKLGEELRAARAGGEEAAERLQTAQVRTALLL